MKNINWHKFLHYVNFSTTQKATKKSVVCY